MRRHGLTRFHGAVAVAGEGEETYSEEELGGEEDEVEDEEEDYDGCGGDDVVWGPASVV